MEDSKQILGTEPVGKLLFKYSLPAIIGMLVNGLYNVVDRIFIGNMPGGWTTCDNWSWGYNAYHNYIAGFWDAFRCGDCD